MMYRHSERGPVCLNGEKSLQDYWRRNPDTGMICDDAALFAALQPSPKMQASTALLSLEM